MGYIPKNSKIKIKIYKSFSVMDIVVIGVSLLIIALVVSSKVNGKWAIALFVAGVAFSLMVPYGEERIYEKIVLGFKFVARPHRYGSIGEESKDRGLMDIELLRAYEDIEDVIVNKDGSFVAVVEVMPVNFMLMGEYSQRGYISAFQGVVNSVGLGESMCVFKRPGVMDFTRQIEEEENRLGNLEKAFSKGEYREVEYKKRKELIEERKGLIIALKESKRVIEDKIYIAFVSSEREGALNLAREAISKFDEIGMSVKMVSNDSLREIVGETEGDVIFKAKSMEVCGMQRSFFCITAFPSEVENGWLASIFSIEGARVMFRINPLDKVVAKKRIDKSILEAEGIRGNGKSSAQIEGDIHAESLKELLYEIADGKEKAYEIEILISVDDEQNSKINRKEVKRKILEMGFSSCEMTFLIDKAYEASLIRRADCIFLGNTLTSNLIAESFPFVSDKLIDDKGALIGENSYPVFLDLFKRDMSRVNSNMVIIGRTGSGKSYATKNILSSLLGDLVKVFVLDPEGEYSKLVKNMGGVVLNVSSDASARINPFEIINSLPDELDKNDCDYYNHLQFLEEFIKTALPGVSLEILERINRLIMEMYRSKGFDEKTNLKNLKPEDYPTFDSLSEYIVEKIKGALDPLEKARLIDAYNTLSKFREGGSMSSLWNGITTFNPKGHLVSYNFQSLLAGKNTAATNAEMLLLLKTMENEIMKNRENNIKNHLNNKLCVVIDEAHVFIDPKYMASLDFMYSLAKRIRKYDGMLIIITQNIKDFSLSAETSRKTSAIINASQYSLIFSLNPGDISDLCELYSKAGEITELEREGIAKSPRGRALLVAGPNMHTFFDIIATKKAENNWME